MRITSYSDYGFEPCEEKRLLQYCQSYDFDKKQWLLQAALASNADLANDIYYSIVGNLSYDRLNTVKYIPASKTDFYGYRRKCLALFRDFMQKGKC